MNCILLHVKSRRQSHVHVAIDPVCQCALIMHYTRNRSARSHDVDQLRARGQCMSCRLCRCGSYAVTINTRRLGENVAQTAHAHEEIDTCRLIVTYSSHRTCRVDPHHRVMHASSLHVVVFPKSGWGKLQFLTHQFATVVATN